MALGQRLKNFLGIGKEVKAVTPGSSASAFNGSNEKHKKRKEQKRRRKQKQRQR